MTESSLRILWHVSQILWEMIICHRKWLGFHWNVSQIGSFSVKIIKIDWVFTEKGHILSQNDIYLTQSQSKSMKITEEFSQYSYFFRNIKNFQNYPPIWAYQPIVYFCYFRRQSKKLKLKNSIPERLIQTTNKRAFNPNKLLFWQ